MTHHSREIRKGRKFEQVLAGAREVFLARGFEGASVDAIARASGVSKATLYSYFPDKQLLFLEVARAECLRQSEEAMIEAADGRSVRETLRDIGWRMTGFFLSDFGLQVFRICVAEAERFPEVAQDFYRSGPELARRRLSDYLAGCEARGLLAIGDCQLAADQFVELCKADLFYRRLFNLRGPATDLERDRVVTAAVETFLARYEHPALVASGRPATG